MILALFLGSVLALWCVAAVMRAKGRQPGDEVRDKAWWTGTVLWWGLAFALMAVAWLGLSLVLGDTL